MKTRIILIGLITILSCHISAQIGGGVSHLMAWTTQAGGTGMDEGVSVAVDNEGYIYTTGNYTSNIDFDPGSGTYTSPSYGGSDVYISKYTPTGNLVWARGFGGVDDDESVALALDADANVYITGTFQGMVDFNAALFTVNNLTSSDNEDIFICKYDSSGQYVWAKQIQGGASNYNKPTDITIDFNSNIHLTGLFSGLLYLEPTPNDMITMLNVVSNGGTDGFAITTTNDGYYLNYRHIGGTGDDNIASVAVDNSSNVYYTGAFNDTVNFGSTSSPFNLTDVVNGMPNCFVLKDNSIGNLVWAKSFEGDRVGTGRSIKLDQNNNVIVLANFDGDVDLDPNPSNINLVSGGIFYTSTFITKLDNSGNYLWGNAYKSNYSLTGSDLAIDKFSNVYFTGSFESTATFDAGNAASIITATAFTDGFVCKLKQNGVFALVRQMAGSGSNNGAAIAVDDCLNTYTTGSFENVTDFRPLGSPYLLTSYGSSDAFVYKLRAVGACGRFKNVSDVESNSNAKSIEGFPNPTENTLTIKLDTDVLSHVLIYDQSGRLLQDFHSKKETLEVDLSNFESGLYVINVEVEGAIQTLRVIKK